MRLLTFALLFVASLTTVLAQNPPANKPAATRGAAPAAQQAEQKSADSSGVDSIIALVKANMSEALVLKTIQRQNKPYDLTPDDLVKLQKAGVSETIIGAMLDPSAASAPAAPTAAPVAASQPAPAPAPQPAPAPVAANSLRATPAQPATAAPAKGAAANSAASAACAPQTAQTAANQKKPGGMFSSFKDKMKASAQTAVDGVGSSVNCVVSKGAEGSQAQASSAMDSAVAVPGQKVADANSSVNANVNSAVDKTTTTANNKTQVPAVKTPAAPAATGARKAPSR